MTNPPAEPLPAAAPLILVVDDEPAMLSIVTFALHTQGFQTVTATDTAAARIEIDSGGIDLVVLDVMLPRESGLSLCREIRATTSIPVILLTARGEADDRVGGLESGADDYVVKPFSPRELALRVDAVLRRGRKHPADHTVRLGDLEMDRQTMRVTVAGEEVNLSAIEYRLLSVLIDNLGSAVRWQDLLEQVWHSQSTRGGRAMIKTTIYRLRARLGDDPANPTFILTVRGVGYRMVRRG